MTMTIDGKVACTNCGARGVPLDPNDECARCKARLEGMNEGEKMSLLETAEALFEQLGNCSLVEPLDIVNLARRVQGFGDLLDPAKVDAALSKHDEQFKQDYHRRRDEAKQFEALVSEGGS
jgi:hypothetical protein